MALPLTLVVSTTTVLVATAVLVIVNVVNVDDSFVALAGLSLNLDHSLVASCLNGRLAETPSKNLFLLSCSIALAC